MNNFDLLKKKAKKLKALADRGIAGEKDSAKNFLEDFMKKHGLTADDVDDNAFIRFFKQRGLDYNTIVTNSIVSMNPFCKIMEEESSYKVSLDDYDFLEVEYKTNFFYDLLLKEFDELFDKFKIRSKNQDSEKELFFTAFMFKHTECFQPDREALMKHQPKQKPMSKKEAEAMKKAQMEAEKAFKKLQEEEAKKNKDDKSKQPPTPINYEDMERMQEIVKLMRDANYVKIRNTLPIFNNKINNEKLKLKKK